MSQPACAKPTNPYTREYRNFVKQTAGHQLTVVKEDGLYRHLRMHDPKLGSIWSWNIVTWPGFLATAGDIADGYMFSRVEDMLAFFDRFGHGNYYSDGAPSIDFRYWAEKLRGGRYFSTQKYSESTFLQQVREHLEEDDELGEAAQEEYDNIVEATRRVAVFNQLDPDEYLARLRALGDSRFAQLPIDENDDLQREYYGLEILTSSPEERRQEILAEAREHAGDEHEARDWLQCQFPHSDTWEWDLRDFDVHFLYACWAIDKTVQAYRAQRNADKN